MMPFHWLAERTTAPLLRKLGIPEYWRHLWTPLIPFLILVILWIAIGILIVLICRCFEWIGEQAEVIFLRD